MFTPPSTSIHAEEPVRAISSRNCLTFFNVLGMNFCPPNPGFTLINNTISTSVIISSSMATGVEGFKVTPAFIPLSLICWTTRCKCVHASKCTFIIIAPNAFTSGMNFSGCTIIRCTSSGFSLNSATYFNTGKPNDILGTNTPSIISKCSQSASLRLIFSRSLLKSAKFAESKDGAILISFAIIMFINTYHNKDKHIFLWAPIGRKIYFITWKRSPNCRLKLKGCSFRMVSTPLWSSK